MTPSLIQADLERDLKRHSELQQSLAAVMEIAAAGRTASECAAELILLASAAGGDWKRAFLMLRVLRKEIDAALYRLELTIAIEGKETEAVAGDEQ